MLEDQVSRIRGVVCTDFRGVLMIECKSTNMQMQDLPTYPCCSVFLLHPEHAQRDTTRGENAHPRRGGLARGRPARADRTIESEVLLNPPIVSIVAPCCGYLTGS